MEATDLDISKIKVIAMDLDGTLTQHRQPVPQEARQMLMRLAEKYKLVMVGAGQAYRIFNQMERFPIDIIGNYGLQYARYDAQTCDLQMQWDMSFPCDRDAVEAAVTMLRQKHGYTQFKGDNVEFHPSGCITFPILGTKADIADKLAFDPDRVKRRKIYDEVTEIFSDYCVFVGGSSSFDMAPHPYNKYYALDRYCAECGYDHSEVVYVGDDYGLGGNDEVVYLSDFRFIKVDDYREFPALMKEFL